MKLNLRVKLIGSFGLILFLMVVVGLGGIYTSKVIQDRMDNILAKDIKSANMMGDVGRWVGLVQANSLLHLISISIDDMNRNESEMADWIDKVTTNLNTLENIFNDQATLDKLAEFRTAWETYLRTLHEQVIPLSRANRGEEAFALAKKTGAGGMAARETLSKLDELHDVNVAAANHRRKKANHDSMKSQYILSAVILLAIIFGLAFGARQGSRIAGSVNMVSKAAQKVAAGDFDQRTVVKTGDEIESMANSFNAMTVKLKTMVEKLQSEITGRKLVEEELAKHRDYLEELVKHRTEELQKEIIERKRASEALQDSEERLKTIFKAIPDPLVAYDVNGYPLYLNPAFTNVFGWSLKEVQGKHIPFVPEDQKEITRLKIRELYEYKNSVLFETKRLSKHGKQIDVLIRAALIKGFKEINNGIIVNLRDITEQRKLKNQLQQSQKMETIGILAGGIAHDFNNILSPILGYTELLLMDIPEDSPFIGNLKQINMAALRAKDLVKQILTFSRQDSSELILIKMQPLVKEALKLIRSTISKTIEIKKDIDPDGGIIRADPTQIHQILMNLATNAYHAMEETGGELRVGLKEIKIHKQDMLSRIIEPGVYVCLTMADTGIGMNKELTQKIFDPFFTTKAKGKGTGMGLSVVHGIVNKMGGTIRVYSEPGKGSEFNVYFPVEKSFSEEQKVQPEEPIACGNEQILLVDDEGEVLTMEKQVLERLGYHVTSRISSLDALEAFRANPDKFDLVITDMAMPNMPGDKLSAELIKIRPDISILLCTGFSQTMSEEKAAAVGIKGFLLKPIVIKNLAQKVREVLDGIKIAE